MIRSDAPRHQLIHTLLMRRPEDVPEVTVMLWEKFAAQLITIIGDGGFDSLFIRSLHMCGKQFPWLIPAPDSPKAVWRFVELHARLADRDSYGAVLASEALFTTFIDILAMMIGEHLTDSILQSAWGAEVSDTAAKDSDHE